MIQKRSCNLRTKVNWNFYEMIEIRAIMINDVNVFIHEYFYTWIFTLKRHKHFTDNLPEQI